MNKKDFDSYTLHLMTLIQYVRKKETNGGVQEELDMAEEFLNRLIEERAHLVELRLDINDIDKLYPIHIEELEREGIALLQQPMSEQNKLHMGGWSSKLLTSLQIMKLKEQMLLNQKQARLVVDYDDN